MRILAIDPGGTTGWAMLDTVSGEGVGGIITGHEWEHVDAVVEMARYGVTGAGPLGMGQAGAEPDVLILEDFQLRTDLHEGAKHKKETLSPVRLNAMIEYTLYRLSKGARNRVPAAYGTSGFIVKQGAADAKRFATDERLERWGLYITPEHARDAMRHAVLYATKHKDEAQAGEDVRRAATAPAPVRKVRGTRRKR